MPKQTWIAEIPGHSIRVENSWTGGAQLYIDGECRDSSNQLFSDGSTALLKARLEAGNDASPLVEVYMRAITSVQTRICVDGKPVAGELF